MKANELMIGDWVQAIDACCGEPCILRVTYIDKWKLERPHVGVDGDISQSSLPADCLEGIPITAEILGKNGFTRYRENEGLWDVGVLRLDLGLFAVGIDNGCGTGMCIMPHGIMTFYCKYVHELQHALRLCGIEDDTIEL